MRRRLLGWMVVLMLLAGGAAACGDDSGGDSGGDSGSDSGDDGDDGGGDINADIQAYCDEVADFLSEVEAAGDDPAALADLAGPAQELGQAGQDLAANAGDFTTEDAEALADCQADATEGLSNLGG
jgi:hypothetical protein